MTDEKPISRQRRWQLKQREAGNCTGCGKPSEGLKHCDDCDPKKAKLENKRAKKTRRIKAHRNYLSTYFNRQADQPCGRVAHWWEGGVCVRCKDKQCTYIIGIASKRRRCFQSQLGDSPYCDAHQRVMARERLGITNYGVRERLRTWVLGLSKDDQAQVLTIAVNRSSNLQDKFTASGKKHNLWQLLYGAYIVFNKEQP